MAIKYDNSSWQFNKNVCERNEHMLDNNLASDVTFRVSASVHDKLEVLKAHTYMLISASPVFWAMFCGEMKEASDVVVCDVEPDAFKEMLRFIYCEKASLNGTNVMHILHAAKKYQLSALANECVSFLNKELNANNVCSVLEHSQFFCETDLVSKCIQLIERNTGEVLATQEFMEVSQNTLSTILESDALSLSEVNIFQRVHDWALNRQTSSRSARETLGDALFKIRFPTMSSKDFVDVVCPTGILTAEEQCDVLIYATSSNKSKSSKSFPTKKRKGRPPARKMKVGDRVRVKKEIKELKHQWGAFTHESIGVVRGFDPCWLRVDFPENADWAIVEEELELV